MGRACRIVSAGIRPHAINPSPSAATARAGFFPLFDRNKKSVALDLRHGAASKLRCG
jgi:crotonobetainyl-CoA:carnitine CoA-transferase CaiB-like acyl-CoA transferase